MKTKWILLSLCLFIMTHISAETIEGSYSYTFGDSESLVEARETCKALAARDALESYLVFVEASTEVENFQLKEDIITTLSTGYLKNLTILDQAEEGRTIIISVSAEVDPEEMKALIADKQNQEPEISGLVAGDTSDVSIQTFDFIKSIPAYEVLLRNADTSLKKQHIQKAVAQYQKSHQFLLSHPPDKKNLFESALYACIMQRSEVIKSYAKLRYHIMQKDKKQRMNQTKILKKQAALLRKRVEFLKKIDVKADKKKILKNTWIKRCEMTLEKIKKFQKIGNK